MQGVSFFLLVPILVHTEKNILSLLNAFFFTYINIIIGATKYAQQKEMRLQLKWRGLTSSMNKCHNPD
jgi:hypothetical protein